MQFGQFGVICGIVAVLCIKLWENHLRENEGQKLPREHDERFG